MPAHVVVWDIETVPDLRGFAAANGHDDKTDDEICEAIGDKFPKHIYHFAIRPSGITLSGSGACNSSSRTRTRWACLVNPIITGADVERYYREGRIREIADYCESDVLNTYRVWLAEI
jgi:predicted PolB exonuclease-like 3'-5' exonuclease